MLLAAAAGSLGSEAVKDVYNVTKQAIKDLFGKEEDLLEALDDVEVKPQSNVRRETLEKKLEKVKFSQNREILEHLARLETLLIQEGLFAFTTYSGTQSGSGGLAQGPGAVAAGKKGLAVGGDINVNVYTGPSPTDSTEALKFYCRVLRNQVGHLGLRGLDKQSSDSKKFSVLLPCLVLCLVSLPSWANPIPETGMKDGLHSSERDLSSKINQYVEASSPERAQELLVDIQRMPDASVESITTILQQQPRYEVQPIGAQPRRSVRVRGQDAEYALYVPNSYTPEKSYPLILCLHGAGFSGEAYLDRWMPRLGEKYILACPSVAMGGWWTRYGEELVLNVLYDVQSQYHIDPDRIFLTGMSNGGIGAWIIGMHHADRFAGIAPMASGIDDVLYPFLENLSHTSVYVIHGAEDMVMPVQLSRDLVKEMERRGIPYIYREHHWTHPHAGGHFFPRQELPDLITWFDGQSREQLPRSVSVVRDATHLTRLYWVRIDMTDQIAAFSENLIDSRDEFITGAVYAKLHAEITASNKIVVNTNRIRRFTVFLNQDLVDFSKPVIVETNGKISFEGMVEPNIETLLQEIRHRSGTHTLFPAKLTIDVPSSVPSID
jgi:dienelactone hydrolase